MISPKKPTPPYSYSRLKKLDCPRQYYHEYVLRRRPPVTEALRRGKYTHSAIERALRAARIDGGVWRKSALREVFRDAENRCPADVKIAPLKLSLQAFENWFTEASPAWEIMEPMIEMPFALSREGYYQTWDGNRLSGGPQGAMLRGYIDFALTPKSAHEADFPGAMVFDWKTGARKYKPGSSDDPDMQLAIYAHAVAQGKLLVSATHFNLRVAKHPETPILLSPAQARETAMAWIISRVDDLESRDYLSESAWEPREIEWCRTCFIRDTCEIAHASRSKRAVAKDGEEERLAVLTGIIRENPDWGYWRVMEFDERETDESIPVTFRATGSICGAQVGQRYRMVGMTETTKWGDSFKIREAVPSGELSLEGVARALDDIPFFGPVRARRAVEIYGTDALNVLIESPDAMAEALGAPKDHVAQASEIMAAKRLEVETKSQLNTLLPMVHRSTVNRLWDRFGGSAIAEVRRDPYALTDVYGIGWLTADSLAEQQGIQGEDHRRVRAGIREALRQAERDGHTGLPQESLRAKARKLLGVHQEIIREAEESLRGEDAPKGYELCAIEIGNDGGPTTLIQTSARSAEEDELVGHLRRLAGNLTRSLSLSQQSVEGLSDDQRAAVSAALRSTVSVITGGPGTGKTYCARVVIDTLRDAGKSRVLVCAPTGKAARVISERVGLDARTIHSTLVPRFAGSGSDNWRFEHGENNKLIADIVVIDEASMVDHWLAVRLFRAIATGTRVLILGDADQLPAVGAGDLLRAMCETGIWPVRKLTQIHRAAARSAGIQACHETIRGSSPLRVACSVADGPASPEARNFWHYISPKESIPALAARIAIQWAPARGYDPIRDVQILSANSSERGPVCAPALNRHMQPVLNPDGAVTAFDDPRAKGARWKIGDRLIQTRNNYGIDLVNGDIVTLVAVEGKKPVVQADDGRRIEIEYADREDLQLAYALTTHKFQGSESPVVIVCVDWGAQHMVVSRNWLYTALSRFQDYVFLLAPSERDIERVVGVQGGRRHVGLIHKIRGHHGLELKRCRLTGEEQC